MDCIKAEVNYDTTALEGLTVEDASPGRIVCRMTVAKAHTNRFNTMHGGCIGEPRSARVPRVSSVQQPPPHGAAATLVDVIGSAVLVTQSDRSGVSLTITTNYLAPTPLGKVRVWWCRMPACHRVLTQPVPHHSPSLAHGRAAAMLTVSILHLLAHRSWRLSLQWSR